MPDTCIADRYQLLAEIGRGTGGSVHVAVDLQTRSRVAVKLQSAPQGHELDLERAGLRALQHPHLVRVLDAGTHAGQGFLVTELVPGGSLLDVSKPLPTGSLQALARQMLEALAFLHAQGILHGDVKTENVLVQAHEPPHFVLGDFGLAHRALGMQAGLRGTPSFMAPELVRGEPADERTDLYALGMTLYECTFGELAFVHEDGRQVLLRQLTEMPSRLLRPGAADASLVQLLRALLAKEPGERPADARQALAMWRGEAAAAPRWVPPHLGVLIGRDAELERLEAALAGDVAAVSLDGPAGTGKTRLLHELALRADLRGTCVVWWAPQGVQGGAGIAVEEDAAGAGARELAESRARALRSRLGPGGWLLLVDDLQDAPDWFRDSLAFAVRDAVGEPQPGRLVCLAGRGEARQMLREALDEVGLPPQPGIELAAWAPRAMERAAQALLGSRRLHPSLMQLLEAATGGIPAALEAACQNLARRALLRMDVQGFLTASAEVGPQDVAAEAGERIASALQRCTPAQLELLRRVTVLRAPATWEFVQAAGREAGRDLVVLQREGLLRGLRVDDLGFFAPAHEGIRRAVVEGMSDSERRRLHDRVADRLESDPGLVPGDDPVPHRARGSDWRAARGAVRQLEGHARPELLREAYAALLEIWPGDVDVEARRESELDLLRVLRRMGAYDAAVERARAALDLSRDASWSQRLRNALAESLLARGDTQSALEILGSEAHGRARLERDSLRARALYQLRELEPALVGCERLGAQLSPEDPLADDVLDVRVLVLREQQRFVEARQLLQQAISRHQRREKRRALAADLAHLGLVEHGQGDMLQAESCFERALETYEQLGDRFGKARMLNCLGAIAAETGRLAEAHELLRRGLDLCRRLGESEHTNYILANLSQLLGSLGCYREALQIADEGLELARRRGMAVNVLRIHIIRAGILATMGLEERCGAELDAVPEGEESARRKTQLYEAQALLIRCDLALQRGDPRLVPGWLERAERIFDTGGVQDERVLLDLVRARWLWSRDEHAAAFEVTRRAACRARELHLVATAADAETQLSEFLLEVGDAQAGEIAQQALETARRAGLPEPVWRCERVLGQLAVRRGDHEQAQEHYRGCIRELQRLCSELEGDEGDLFLSQPARLRVFEELASFGGAS